MISPASGLRRVVRVRRMGESNDWRVVETEPMAVVGEMAKNHHPMMEHKMLKHGDRSIAETFRPGIPVVCNKLGQIRPATPTEVIAERRRIACA